MDFCDIAPNISPRILKSLHKADLPQEELLRKVSGIPLRINEELEDFGKENPEALYKLYQGYIRFGALEDKADIVCDIERLYVDQGTNAHVLEIVLSASMTEDNDEAVIYNQNRRQVTYHPEVRQYLKQLNLQVCYSDMEDRDYITGPYHYFRGSVREGGFMPGGYRNTEVNSKSYEAKYFSVVVPINGETGGKFYTVEDEVLVESQPNRSLRLVLPKEDKPGLKIWGKFY